MNFQSMLDKLLVNDGEMIVMNQLKLYSIETAMN